MDDPRAPGTLQRVGASARGITSLATMVLLLVAVAILKPWGEPVRPSGPEFGWAATLPSGAGDPLPTASATGDVRAAGPLPSPAADEIECHGGWELVSLTRLADWSVREWLPIEPSVATGPADPSLVAIPLTDGSVRALGVCAGSGKSTAPSGLAIVAAWRLPGGPPGAPVPIPLTSLTGPAGHGAMARLYRPTAARRGEWPNGRYVIEMRQPGGGPARWLSLQIGATAVARVTTP